MCFLSGSSEVHLKHDEQKNFELEKKKTVDLLELDGFSFCSSFSLQANVLHKQSCLSLES